MRIVHGSTLLFCSSNIIKHNYETIIRNWWLKNLGVECSPYVYITFDLLVDFWMPVLSRFLATQSITHFHGSTLLFCSSNIIIHNYETIIRNWWLKNFGITCYPWIHITFDLIIDFWMPFRFVLLVHRILPTCMAIHLGTYKAIMQFSYRHLK